MRPSGLKTKIFLDSGDPKETQQTLEMIGFLDGQTTNPTLVSRHPLVKQRLERGELFNKIEVYKFYKEVVQEISSLIPQGSVSIEVYADQNTSDTQMFEQSQEMFKWIPNAHIKFPVTSAGLSAAILAIKNKLRINFTLVFSQEQAAAVYAATQGAEPGQIFISPFVGRLDDKGWRGMDLITNILKMYEQGDKHVQVLTASVRTYDHFLAALALGSDIVTVPYKIISEWVENNLELPDENFIYQPEDLKPIEFLDLDVTKDWHEYYIAHELTSQGIASFSHDWNNLVK